METEEKMSTLFPKCPVCGGEMTEKMVGKLLRGGGNTAYVRVKAKVCLHCGERLYSTDTIKRFEEIRSMIDKKKVKGLKAIGKSYKVA